MKKIYNNNKDIITTIKSSVNDFRRQNYYRGQSSFIKIIDQLRVNVSEVINYKSYFNERIVTVDEIYIMEVIENITNAQNHSDYILLSDLLELQLMPLLIQWQEIIMLKENVLLFQDMYEQNIQNLEKYDINLAEMIRYNMDIESEYVVESTTNGSVTVKIIRDNQEFYLVSNNDPQNASKIFADTYYNPRISHYTIFGMELLNNGNALLEYKNAENVDVYESDINIIKLACRYGNMHHLTTGRLNIYYDPDYIQFAKASQSDSKNSVVGMHQPTIRNIKDDRIRGKFENLFIVDSSIRNQGDSMISNFISNIKNCDHYIDELLPEFKGKDVYIIAAGPSLDKNIELLKEKPANSIILAVGTVHRKLESIGIQPDYTIIADAQKNIIEQIVDLKDNHFSLLVLSTAYREIAKINEGKKYLICQHDFPDSKEYAEKNNWNLYQSGGSVTTTALDVSIRLKASKIIFLGADMANTGNLTHASGTARRENIGLEGLIPVKSIDGGVVYSTRILCMYREWIENRIAVAKDVEVIDATEGGAMIKGTKICSLLEIIQ
ncbi:MAG: motility associated factor glycosyltransferase family protein [Lachnotalea sp.]